MLQCLTLLFNFYSIFCVDAASGGGIDDAGEISDGDGSQQCRRHPRHWQSVVEVGDRICDGGGGRWPRFMAAAEVNDSVNGGPFA